jgi:hypothetical protein
MEEKESDKKFLREKEEKQHKNQLECHSQISYSPEELDRIKF